MKVLTVEEGGEGVASDTEWVSVSHHHQKAERPRGILALMRAFHPHAVWHSVGVSVLVNMDLGLICQ